VLVVMQWCGGAAGSDGNKGEFQFEFHWGGACGWAGKSCAAASTKRTDQAEHKQYTKASMLGCSRCHSLVVSRFVHVDRNVVVFDPVRGNRVTCDGDDEGNGDARRALEHDTTNAGPWRSGRVHVLNLPTHGDEQQDDKVAGKGV